MQKAMDSYFSVEPMHSLREYFDVYSVTVVSVSDSIDGGTALGTTFTGGTSIKGDNEKCKQYATKVPLLGNSVRNTPMIVVMNSPRYAGTTYMHSLGYSIAFCPYVDNDDERFAQIIHHEAVGHGFGYLGDEYDDVYDGEIPPNVMAELKEIADRYGAGISVHVRVLFLAALYESWMVPVAVLLSLPVAALGAYLGVWGCGLENDVYFQIGLVMLVGLAAKNAILIVEFAKEQVDRGIDVVQAALHASQLRFRPILMTSLAFILGMLPMVIASGPGSASRQAIGTSSFSKHNISFLTNFLCQFSLYHNLYSTFHPYKKPSYENQYPLQCNPILYAHPDQNELHNKTPV